jgi:hypothetical protein
MPGGFRGLAHVARQQPGGPKFVRISELLSFAAGQRHQPGLGVRGDLRRFTWPRAIVEGRHHTEPHGPSQTPQHGLVGHTNRFPGRVG